MNNETPPKKKKVVDNCNIAENGERFRLSNSVSMNEVIKLHQDEGVINLLHALPASRRRVPLLSFSNWLIFEPLFNKNTQDSHQRRFFLFVVMAKLHFLLHMAKGFPSQTKNQAQALPLKQVNVNEVYSNSKCLKLKAAKERLKSGVNYLKYYLKHRIIWHRSRHQRSTTHFDEGRGTYDSRFIEKVCQNGNHIEYH